MLLLLAALNGCARGPAPAADPQVVTVSGHASVETATGADLPLRQTQVEAVSADQDVLFSTWTDAQGAYTVVVPAATAFTLRASSRADSGDDSGWSVSVETSSGDLYHATDTAAATAGNAVRDLYIKGEQAAPFALLEYLQDAYDRARELWPEGSWPPLAAVLNDKANGKARAGYRLDSHGLLPTLVLRQVDRRAALEGFARYLQLYAFRDESPVHGEAIDDPRTQFGRAFNAALTNYLLADQAPQEQLTMTDPLAALLDDIMQGRGGVGLMRAELAGLLSSPELLEFDGVMTAHAFLAAVRQAYPDRGIAIEARAAPLGIGADPYGADGAEPLYSTLQVGETITLCGGSQPGASGHRLVKLKLPESGRYQLSAIDAGSAIARTNPEMILYRAGAQSLAGYSQQARAEVVEHSLPAGNYVLDVFDRSNADGDPHTGGQACFAVALHPTDPFAAPVPAPACDNLASLATDPRCQAPEASGMTVGF